VSRVVFFLVHEVKLAPNCGHQQTLLFPQILMIYECGEPRWNDDTDVGKPKNSEEKTYPAATLSTTNPTWTDRGADPGLCGGRPATNRLS
jgi:hypothetical protein